MKLYFIFTCVVFLHQSSAQRPPQMFKTKFRDCGGDDRSQLLIKKNVAGQPAAVTMSAPFDRKVKKHVLFKERLVRICINATIPANPNLNFPITGKGLKNAAFGLVLVQVPFCEIEKNACVGITPKSSSPRSCPDLRPGDEVQFCSSITVPDIAPVGLDVPVTWKILQDDPLSCELGVEKKPTLVCIVIDTTIRLPKNKRG